ncbi:MAG: ABC transporter permease [Bacteroidota bacterium]
MPIYVKYKGEQHFPIFKEKIDLRGKPQATHLIEWEELEAAYILWPPIPYKTSQNQDHATLSPSGDQITRKGEKLQGSKRHWLGSGRNGSDILAIIIHGSQRALGVGIFTMSIVFILGVLIGGLAGYYQDHKLFIKRIQLWLLLPALVLAWFYAFYLRRFALGSEEVSGFIYLGNFLLSLLIALAIIGLFFFLGKKISWGKYFNQTIPLALDSLFSRFMEILQSIPSLLLIISLAAFFESKNIWFIMLIVALISWIGIARIIRSEMLSISQRPFIYAAKGLGISSRDILFKHLLPNSLMVIWPILALGMGSTILLESTLSFLQLVEGSGASWGGLLTEGKLLRQHPWIALFPGISIFLTVYSFNILGERLRESFDPRSN